MAAPHTTKLFGINDAKIAVMTADGAPPTYGSLVDVPGIKSIQIAGQVKSIDLRGDMSLLESDAVVEGLTVTVNYAYLALDLIAAICGYTVTDSGTGSAEIATMPLISPTFPYFKLEAKINNVSVGLGDAHVLLDKMKIASFPFSGIPEEDYGLGSFQAKAVLSGNSRYGAIILNETAAAIA